ncbi:hypothetical protein BpHYR1_005206 [Brachionus plicatilis]|uniref:Uncharacterized protein n=1 Tax=Brachionus plicatilis TaxID=10195 RepID=A0A3M7PBG8_BRAPC|nr:hypothetical protein BpHYR1_005206 [Brachionus plicatilis]
MLSVDNTTGETQNNNKTVLTLDGRPGFFFAGLFKINYLIINNIKSTIFLFYKLYFFVIRQKPSSNCIFKV